MQKSSSTMSKIIQSDVANLTRRRKQILRELGYSEELDSAQMAEKLREQRRVHDCLERIIAKKEDEIDQKKKSIEEKEKIISDLKARISELEGKLQVPAKTSANSSVPPSKNPIGVPHTQSLRKKSNRPSGGQKGHPGVTRTQDVDAEPDKVELWSPQPTCPICGRPLGMDNAEMGEVRHVIDIPFPISAILEKHVSLRVTCECGHQVKGVFPDNVKAPVSFGPNIKAFVTYLSTYQNVPFKKLTHIIKSLFGLSISEGTISNMLNDMRKCSKRPYEMIREKIAKSEVNGADETGINVSGKNNWMWTFQNKVATYLAIGGGRGHNVINEQFSQSELSGKTYVTDRLPAYFMDEVGIGDHQICLAHLLRNLTYTMQTFKDDPWSLDMMDLLRDAIHRQNEGEFGEEMRKEMESRLGELLSRPPMYKTDDGKPTELDTLKSGIAKHRDHIFTFLTNVNVPPTNNDSEKALRPVKTKQKVSGCFRSKGGAENYATIGSVIQTAIKNGQDPFQVLRVIATVAAE